MLSGVIILHYGVTGRKQILLIWDIRNLYWMGFQDRTLPEGFLAAEGLARDLKRCFGQDIYVESQELVEC